MKLLVSACGRTQLILHEYRNAIRDPRPFQLPLMRAFLLPLRALTLLVPLVAVAACGRTDAAPRTAATPVSTTTGAPNTPAASPRAVAASAPGDTLSDSALIAKADRGRLMGRDSGVVWLVMISDFQCPYCKQWHDSSMAAVKRDYIDPGKVRMAFLNLPLQQHPHARVQAEAALCAAAQDKFWPYSGALFHDQNSLNARVDVKPYLDSLARSNSIDMKEFARCRSSKAIQALIESDIQQAGRAGVRSTPSFLVGEFLVEGAVPYKDFRKAIDTALVMARTKRSR